jgi:hypothetical protein
MATLDPIARRSHRPDRIQVDVPAPECTLSTIQPIGAHLVVLLTAEQARRLHRTLSHVLEQEAEEAESGE